MTERRPLQADDLMKLHFLNGAALSPDGSRVVYSVNKIDAEAQKEFRTLYLHDLDSGATRQMTSGGAVDGGAIFSPDGQTIAFTSDRSGQAQLYLLPVDGGEARQMTSFKRGIGGELAWSPDGGQIAFCAKPDVDAPDLATEPYRVDRTVYRFDGIGYLDDEAQDIYTLDISSGETTRLTDDRCNNHNPRWSPDGAQILFDADMRVDAARAMTPDLKLADMAGQVSTLLDGWASIAKASFTPDGAGIVFIGRPQDGKPIGTKSDLYTLDLETDAIACRTTEFAIGIGGRLSMDMPVSGLSLANVMVSDAGDFALTSVQRGGTDHIYRVALSGPERVEAVTEGDCAVFPLDRRGSRLLYARTSLNAPPELVLAELDGGEARQLTQLNADFLAGIDLPATEHLHWQSVDGVDVEGWFMRPPAGQAPYPTILYIHGGPHAAYGCGFHFDFQMLAGAGYGVLFLNHRAFDRLWRQLLDRHQGRLGQFGLSRSDDRRRPCHWPRLG